MVTRILIADDHSVVRQGLRMFLALDPDLEVVGEAADGAEALRLAHELHPDVILMDILMPKVDGPARSATSSRTRRLTSCAGRSKLPLPARCSCPRKQPCG